MDSIRIGPCASSKTSSTRGHLEWWAANAMSTRRVAKQQYTAVYYTLTAQYVQTPKGTPKNNFQIWQLPVKISKHRTYRPRTLAELPPRSRLAPPPDRPSGPSAPSAPPSDPPHPPPPTPARATGSLP